MAITNKDVDKMVERMKEVFVTKEDSEKFATKEEAKKQHDEVMTGQDAIMKELEIARNDRKLAVGKDRDQDRRLV
jgi:hypothetical protein